MKRFLKNIIGGFVIFGVMGMYSCEDYLDKSDDTIISEEEAFKNFTNFQGFTEEMYNCVVDFSKNYWTNSFNWGEDELLGAGGNFHYGPKIDQGNFWGWQSEHDGWGAGWMNSRTFTTDYIYHPGDPRNIRDLWNAARYGIRKANVGLANMDLMTDATQEERDLIKGQLLFFRGWFHFRLMEYFGGLPYIDEVLASGEAMRLPRLSYHECADKAAADFRAASELLPIDWDKTSAGARTLGKNELRINKIMALGYLGKNYLWAGSPLMNYESTGSKTYNEAYCKKAAQAFGELLTLVESGSTQYSLVSFDDISSVVRSTGKNFVLPGGTEAIFRAPYRSANQTNWGLSKQYLPSINATIGEGDLIFSPTANYISYYGMANGLPIQDITKADAESGYDPEYPWKGRDPRFYNDIAFDGVRIVQTTMPENLEQHRYANLYTDGSYRNVATGSRTGFILRKISPLSVNRRDKGADWGHNLHIMISYMRLADIYLMYAEAAAMGYGSSAGISPNYSKTAVDAVNVIRNRAGAGQVHSKFLGSADVFINEVRRERAVELAFEAHRFNDLRRWLLLTEGRYKVKTALEFQRAGEFSTTDPAANRVANLREVVLVDRDFSEKHYWLPLKVADVNMYPEFKQNPGW
jgi:starch-binding outer membrane protein, SusD/RagB family